MQRAGLSGQIVWLGWPSCVVLAMRDVWYSVNGAGEEVHESSSMAGWQLRMMQSDIFSGSDLGSTLPRTAASRMSIHWGRLEQNLA